MHIVLAQLNYQIGDFLGNRDKILETVEARGRQADLIVFTELAITGYYPYDLIERDAFLHRQNTVLEEIAEKTKHLNCGIVLGVIEKNTGKGKRFFNALVVVHQGKIIHRYQKQRLPIYNIFDEARHFQPGVGSPMFEWCGLKLALLICEDAWGGHNDYYLQDPVGQLVDTPLDLCVVINASPSNLGKQAERLSHMKSVVDTLQVPLIYVNQVGGNDDIVYDGHSFVLDKTGTCLGTLPAFKAECGTVVLEKGQLSCQDGFNRLVSMPNEAFLYEQIGLGLRDYLRKCGFEGVVIGISGGIDSGVTLALAAKTLGPDKVCGIFMPTEYTSHVSEKAALELCNNFGVKLYHYPLTSAFNQAKEAFQNVFQEKPKAVVLENMQARRRGQILMEYSNQTGFMVLSTGNKSELSVGYTTLYGDMTGGLNIIGDVYKTQVYDLAHYMNEIDHNPMIPEVMLSRAPSAELAPNQKDTDTLPPYEALDPVLKLYLEGDLLDQEEIDACEKVLKGLPPKTVHQIHKMVDHSEFKRRQSSPILRVQRRSFGLGRRMPISAKFYAPSDHFAE